MNKKQLVLLVYLVVSLTFAAYAQQGGYKGPGMTPVTVEEAKNLPGYDLPRYASVILQGKIERFVMPRQYVFSDDTGEILVLIEDKIWGDVSVDENDTVEIRGVVWNQRGQWVPHYVTVQSIRKL
ncbi:MAG: NirD/YgiW/YdeI family stress tolerance protein [Treponema sp.]|nr:NirD/YgiW/YdeI family stress tolerance protein [Treponema sp.]